MCGENRFCRGTVECWRERALHRSVLMPYLFNTSTMDAMLRELPMMLMIEK